MPLSKNILHINISGEDKKIQLYDDYHNCGNNYLTFKSSDNRFYYAPVSKDASFGFSSFKIKRSNDKTYRITFVPMEDFDNGIVLTNDNYASSILSYALYYPGDYVADVRSYNNSPKKVRANIAKNNDLSISVAEKATSINRKVDASRLSNCSLSFANFSSIKKFDNIKWPVRPTQMTKMFYNDTSLESVPVFDTSRCPYFISAFEGCQSLPAVFPYPISLNSVTDINELSNMFEDSSVREVTFTDVPSDVASSVTSYLLTDSNEYEMTINITEKPTVVLNRNTFIAGQMVAVQLYYDGDYSYDMKYLLKEEYTAKYDNALKTAAEIPYLCYTIDASDVTDASKMFEGFDGLTEIPTVLYPSKNFTSTARMFAYCKALTSVPEIDTSGSTDMKEMFRETKSLPEEFPYAIDCGAITFVEHLKDIFKDSSVTKVTFKNIATELVSDITSELLKGDNTLAVSFE